LNLKASTTLQQYRRRNQWIAKELARLVRITRVYLRFDAWLDHTKQSVITLYRTSVSLDGSDRRLILEAASLMILISAGLRLLRLRTLFWILDCYVKRTASIAGLDHHGVARVRWAITAIADRFPSATCLVRALAADALIRRRGLESVVRIGVRIHRNSTVPFEAHAWVECHGVVVIGDLDHLSTLKVVASRTQ
jgi:hypothetical protein